MSDEPPRPDPAPNLPPAGGAPSQLAHMSPEALLAAVVENSDDAIVAKTLDGAILTWNKGAERLFGWRADEIVGKSIRLLIPEDRQAEEEAIIRQIVAGRRVSAMHTERLRKNGAKVRVSITVSPVRDADGRIIGASKIARDVGALEIARHQLQQSERRFRMLSDNIAQLAWIAEADGAIHWYNKRWYDYTGATPEEMDGWGWSKVHHPDHIDRVTANWRKSLDSGQPWEDTFPLRGRNGRYRWFLSRARPIEGEDGTIACWFGSNTDVTEQREQADAIQALLNEVNHRSKNMLTLIQSLARRSAPGNEQFVKRFVRRLDALAANQDLLVRREWTHVDLGELIAAQLAFAIDIAEGQIHFAGPPVELGARAAETLGMALHELATNALKYGALSNDRGRVDIGWQLRGEDLSVEWVEAGGPRVTEPERTGFGTAVIRDIPLAALDASIELDFARDGLRWRMDLPLAAASPRG